MGLVTEAENEVLPSPMQSINSEGGPAQVNFKEKIPNPNNAQIELIHTTSFNPKCQPKFKQGERCSLGVPGPENSHSSTTNILQSDDMTLDAWLNK